MQLSKEEFFLNHRGCLKSAALIGVSLLFGFGENNIMVITCVWNYSSRAFSSLALVYDFTRKLLLAIYSLTEEKLMTQNRLPCKTLSEQSW